MTQNWTSKLARSRRKLGQVFRTESYPRRSADIDADARRVRHELDAIRARFPDHA